MTVRRLLLAASVSVVLAYLSPLSATSLDQYFHKDKANLTGTNMSDYAAGWRKLAIDDSFNGSATSSIFSAKQIGSDTTFETCETVGSGACLDPSNSYISGESILPICQSDESSNCVLGLSIGDLGEVEPALYGRSIQGFTFPESPEELVPAGGTVSIWNSTSTPHTGGSEYAVSAQVNWYKYGAVTTYRNLTIRVAAVQERAKAGARVTIPYVVESGVPGANRLMGRAANHYPGKEGCFYVQDEICGYEQEFAPDTRIKLSLRVSNRVTGWLFGRLKDPEVAIQDLGNGQNLVEIEANPVAVPKFHAQWNVADVPGVIDDSVGRGAFGDGNLMAGSTDQDAFSIVSKLRETMNDKSSGEKGYWSLASVQGQTICPTVKPGLTGIVTTNAMVFSGGAPSFQSGFLNYQVGGLHFGSDGLTVHQGTYDLIMRSDVARCLYGFTKAPVSATVTVVGTDGVENVATTVVSERDGWLKLAAYGFTFSEKEIKVKITQPQIRTLSLYSGRATALTNTQKVQIRATLAKSDGSTKFICTGIRYFDQPVSENILVRKRAKLACDYAKSLRPDLSYWYQTKTTQAKSYNGRVLVVSK